MSNPNESPPPGSSTLQRKPSSSSTTSSLFRRPSGSSRGQNDDISPSSTDLSLGGGSGGGLLRRLSKKARTSIGHSLRPRLGSMSENPTPQVFDITHPSLERFFWYLYSPAPDAPPENGEEPPRPAPDPNMTQEERDKLPKYRLVRSEAEIGRLLERAEGFLPQSSWKGLKDVSVVSFQAEGEIANLLIVYDGHAGDLAVDHAHAYLPSYLRSRLTSLPPTSLSDPELISDALKLAMQDFDAEFLAQLTDKIPSWEEIDRMSDTEVKELLMKDGGEVNEWARKVATGNCAVVGLVVGRDVWVAGLGDCEGVLAIKDQATDEWEPQTMAIIQNHSNPEEISRVRAEHPNEPAVFVQGRFCGLILCSRAFGDAWMKFPATFATKVMPNTEPAGRSAVKIAAVAKERFLTPPYISSTADVKHHRLPEGLPSGHVALMLASDGFRDMPFPRTEGVPLETEWAKALGSLIDADEDEIGGNGLAAQLLRRSWQREDLHLASAMTTLPMKTMDDVTVLVAVL